MTWVRCVGLGLLLAWAGFWVWFNVASAFGERSGLGWAGIEVGHLALGAVIAAVSVLAWRWPMAGCPVLLALAGFGLWFFGPKPFLLLTLLAPPVAAAALLLAAALGKRTPATPRSTER
jgi:hypothetical protein